MNLKTGTRIEVFVLFPGAPNEKATIARWLKKYGPRERTPGYHCVQFANGGVLLVHETSFRVVDNRKRYQPQ